MTDEVGFIRVEKGVLKKIGFAVLIASLLFFVLGLAFFLQGPDERIVMLNATEDYEIFLAPRGNKTIDLSSLFLRGVSKYMDNSSGLFLNLRLLINYTIDIRLKMEKSGEVNLYIMNSTQFKLWKNGSAPSGGITEKETTKLIFPPKNVWEYFLVLVNMRNSSINVSMEVSQQFLVKRLDYGRAFIWLNIAVLSAIPLFLLQIPLKVTFWDIKNRIIEKMLPARYRKYAKAGERSFLSILTSLVFIIPGAILLLVGIIFSREIDKEFGEASLINQLFKDSLYRFLVETFLLCVVFAALFLFLGSVLWDLLNYPLKHKYYPNPEIYEKRARTEQSLLQKSLVEPQSILFYLCFSALFVLMLLFVPAHQINVYITLLFLVPLLLLALYFGYITSRVYLKTQQIFPIDPTADFKYIKATTSSFAIVSVVAVYILQAFVPFVNLTSKYIINQSILVSSIIISAQEVSLSWIPVEVFNYIASFLPNFIFLTILILHWSQTIFSVIYWPRKKEFKDIRLPKNILTDFVLDLLFFLVVFVFSLLITSGSSSQPQSLVGTVNPQEILSSLISALIASSFEDYLEAIRPSVH